MLYSPPSPYCSDLTVMESAASTTPNRRRAATWGVLFGSGGAFLAIARNILLVPLYLKFVSLAEYGAWLATGATLIQLLVSDFGLAGVLMQRSAALHGAGEGSRLGVLMGSGILAGGILSVVLLLGGVVTVGFLPIMGGLTVSEGETVTNCLYLAVVATALGIVAAIAMGLLRSLQRGAEAGSIAISAEIANIGLSTALLFDHAGLYALVWGMVARSVIMVSASSLSLLRARGGVKFDASLSEVKSLFADVGTSLATSMAMKSLAQTNTLLVGVMLGPTSAAAYGLTVRAHETLSMFLGQLNAAFAPGMAHLWGSGNALRFRALLLNVLAGSALLAGLGVVAVICSNETFMTLWLRRPVFGGQATSILMGFAVWISQVGYVAYDSLYALGRFRFIARTFVMSAVAQLSLTVCLLHVGLWTVPLVMVAVSSLWAILFWKRVAADIGLTDADCNFAIGNLTAISTCGVVVAAVGLTISSLPESWDGLVLRATGSSITMLSLVLIVSGRIRTIVLGELRMTVRSFLSRREAS